MAILILGAPDEDHAAHLFQALSERQADPVYFDTRNFPAQLKLSYSPAYPFTGSLKTPEGKTLSFEAIRAVYWRTYMGIQTSGEESPYAEEMAGREIQSALSSWMRNLDCRWVNPIHAIEMHRSKAHQTHLLNMAGIRTPRTLISNDPEAVTAFCEAEQMNVIYKPVSGGAHTQKITCDDLTPERLKELSKAPVQFQECIDGTDIRVYLLGEQLFAAEIQSQTLDFRDDPTAPIIPISLPEQVQEDCRTLAELFGLCFTGIDIRRTPTGEYVFLEGNPSPMFIYFEKVTEYPITQSLVELLLND